ncbi:MAG: hypothetical protein J6U13_08200 [Salinivirgaceae bacterium]|nr:hypothetical protein [Salinivirgaceae bacterium]
MENQKTQFPDGKIELLNGTILDCYPTETPCNEWVNRSIPRQVGEQGLPMFAENAFLFFENRERILSDSRMFLAPVHIQSGLAYCGTGGFTAPTLGIYIEWWMNCRQSIRTNGRTNWLTIRLAGSPLSGANSCTTVSDNGVTDNVFILSFSAIWHQFVQINKRYNDAKIRYQAYSLAEVIDILKKEGRVINYKWNHDLYFLKNSILNLKEEVVHNNTYIRKTVEEHLPEMKIDSCDCFFDKLNRQYLTLVKNLVFSGFSPAGLWIDIKDERNPTLEMIPDDTHKERYIRILKLMHKGLEEELQRLQHFNIEINRYRWRKDMNAKQAEARKYFIERKIRQKELDDLRAQTREKIAELRRLLRSGKIDNKQYQRTLTPLKKKLSDAEISLQRFQSESIKSIRR